jgi:hypothetical protein
VLFEPLNLDGHKRSVIYHAARLEMLHKRVVKRMEQTDHAAETVEDAAEILAEAVRPA